jgi:outer membrane receptor protein involved in Fe transport
MKMRRRPLARVTLLAVASVLPPAALAQSVMDVQGDRGRGADREMQEVNVNARRSLEERFFSAGSRVTVDRQDIEQMGADTAADVLQRLPGVQVTGGASGNLVIRMRGMDANQTQVLVDGERQGGGRRGGAQLPFDQLPADMIERIEVIRAPTAEFTGAAGGTINIVMRQAATIRRETSIRLANQMVWGFNGLQGFFSHSGPLTAVPRGEDGRPVPGESPWGYSVMGALSQRFTGFDTERTTTTRNAAGAVTATSNSTDVFRNRSNEFMLMPRITGRLSARDQVILRAQLVGNDQSGQFTTRGSGSAAAGATSSDLFQGSTSNRQYINLRGDWNHRLSVGRVESRLSYGNNLENFNRDGSQTVNNGTGPTFTRSGFYDRRNETTWQAASKVTGARDQLLWSGGAEYEDRQLKVDSGSGTGAAGGAAPVLTPQTLTSGLRRAVLWGQNEWAVLGNSTLTLGLRREQLKQTSTVVGGVGTNGVFGRSLGYWQPSAHLRIPQSEDLQWRFNLARTTRTPALLDSINRTVPSQGINSPSNADQAGNPNLRPETTVALDMGFDHKLSGNGQAGVNLFVRRSTDVLARVTSQDTGGRWVSTAQNLGTANVWGLETDFKQDVTWPTDLGWGRGWNVNLNASVLESRLVGGATPGARIPGQARYLATLSLQRPMQRAGWFGGVNLSLTGSAELNTAATANGRQDATHSLDFFVGQVVPGYGFWRLGVFNLTNAKSGRTLINTDNAGNRITDASSTTTTPRILLAFGTRF